MTRSEQWTTSVSDLLGLFRDALVALVPIAERARIRWRDGEAYDDWDAIASAIFDNLVVRSLNYSDALPQPTQFAGYDTVLPSYRNVTFLSVAGPDIPPGVRAAFI